MKQTYYFIFKRFSIQVNVPCVGSVPRGTGPTHIGFSAPLNKGTFLDFWKKTNAICIGQVGLFQPVMMYFYPSGNNRKFNEYWVSWCFMAKQWQIYNLIFSKLVDYYFLLFWNNLYFGFSLIIYSIRSTRHIKPRMNILGK